MGVDKAELDGYFILNNRVSVVDVSSGRAVSADDIFQYLRTNGTSAFSISVPSCSEVALPVGSFFTLRQAGTGQVTFVAGSGVSIAVRTSGTLMTARRHAVVTLTKVAADTWDLDGDVSIT